MFTGIIEEKGTVLALKKARSNLHISIKSSFLKEIKVDQSIAHNGVCLTVIKKTNAHYTVTAVKETLERSNIGLLHRGDKINLERCMKSDGRFDGHIVQGHVDCTAKVHSIKEQEGSRMFTFKIKRRKTEVGSRKKKEYKIEDLIVEKGSVCVNGVSLTVVDCTGLVFSVAIIPYTYNHTNFHLLKPGDIVNIEFDIIGKYVAKMADGIYNAKGINM